MPKIQFAHPYGAPKFRDTSDPLYEDTLRTAIKEYKHAHDGVIAVKINDTYTPHRIMVEFATTFYPDFGFTNPKDCLGFFIENQHYNSLVRPFLVFCQKRLNSVWYDQPEIGKSPERDAELLQNLINFGFGGVIVNDEDLNTLWTRLCESGDYHVAQ